MASHPNQVVAPETVTGDRPDNDIMLSQFMAIEEEFCSSTDFISMLTERKTCNSNLVWRELVCKWSYDVVDLVGEARSVVYVAMNVLDRFCAVVARNEPMNEKKYECASMTALFLAARVAGTCNLQVSDLIRMSRDSLQLQDIISTGKQMLNVLTWGPRMITPVDFLQAMSKLLPTSVQEERRRSLFESASFLVEIAVCDIFLSRFPASQVAFASILNAANAEGVLSSAEHESFRQRVRQQSSLLDSSTATRTIRARLASVYTRIEHNHRRENRTTPHYISDDEEEEETSLFN